MSLLWISASRKRDALLFEVYHDHLLPLAMVHNLYAMDVVNQVFEEFGLPVPSPPEIDEEQVDAKNGVSTLVGDEATR